MSEVDLITPLQDAVKQAERTLIDARAALQDAIWRRDRKCYRCGATDEQNEEAGYGPLIDFTLVTSEGEEGYAKVERLVCQEHFEWLIPHFEAIGFTIHAHGGICFLEAQCVPNAYENCPTPENQFDD